MKRRTFALAVALCLLLIIGFGTLAYFQSSARLTNYFAVAGIQDPTDPDEEINPDTLFSLKLDETDIKNGGRTEKGNTYEGIMPGQRLVKDPTVKNTGKYPAWVRVMVTLTDAKDWLDVCAKHKITNLATIFEGHKESEWVFGGKTAVDKDNKITYTYYLKEMLAANESATLFDAVIIPGCLDVEDMAKLSTFQLQIVGQSIQYDNNGASAMAAFGNWDPNVTTTTDDE